MKRKLFAVSMAAAMATSCFAGTAFASDSEPVTIKLQEHASIWQIQILSR